MTTPTAWTTSYADTFRDRTKFISPTAEQPMHHYPGAYDKSHYGNYGEGSRNNASSMHGASQNGNYQAQHQSYNSTTTTQNSSTSHMTTADGVPITNTSQIPNAVANPNGFGLYFPKAIPGGKDLWTQTPNATHGGIVPIAGVHGSSDIRYQGRNISTNNNSNTYTTSQYNEYSGTGNLGSLGDDARPKYHIPGYAGFVRGQQNRYGDTYGKMTRMALDVPTDTPLEP